MAEYIDREALMRRIKEIYCAECDSYHGVRCRACWADDTLDYIESEPAADVEPVQEWISVDDRLPQYTDEYNVTVGVPSEFGYFEKVKTLRFERINGKEPRWVIPKNEIYNVIAWMELPKKYQPPKGE